MSTNNKNRAIVRRKKLRTIEELTDAEKYQLLEEYKAGKGTLVISEGLRTSENTVKQFIHKHYNNFTNIVETNKLISHPNNYDVLRRSRQINEEFLSLLEEGAAQAYAWYFGKTGDNKLALKESGLDKGIIITKGKPDSSVNTALKLRGMYLREIPEVKKEIARVREDKLRDSPVTKDYVQTSLVEQIEEMKEVAVDNSNIRGNIIRSIELLGKSIGAFTDRVEVHEVDPDRALDTLIEMAQSTYEVIEDE